MITATSISIAAMVMATGAEQPTSYAPPALTEPDAIVGDELFLGEAPMDATALSEARGGMESKDFEFGGFAYSVFAEELLGSAPTHLAIDGIDLNQVALAQANAATAEAALRNASFDPILGQRVINNTADNVIFTDGFRIEVAIPNFDAANGLHQAAAAVSGAVVGAALLTTTGF